MRNPKVIVITGASSGLGEALAKIYAAPGIILHLLGRDCARLELVQQACQKLGADTFIYVQDVTDKLGMANRLEAIDRKTPVDLIIANAGVSAGTLGGEDVEQVLALYDCNINGVIHTIHPLLPLMGQRRKGQIVIVSSLAGLLSLPGCPAYSASKAAVRVYGEALRGLLAADGVEVSVVLPGYIRTPMTDINPYPMPFIMDAEQAASLIKNRLVKNPARIAFPGIFYRFILSLNSLPVSWLIHLLAKLPAKPNLKS